jgi:transposase
MKKIMTKLLNLPGVIVEDSRQTDETLIFSVKVETKTALVGIMHSIEFVGGWGRV